MTAFVALPLPNQIANGGTTDASQVMGNLNAIANSVNANVPDITALLVGTNELKGPDLVSSASPNIWLAAQGNSMTITGIVTTTGFATAPQAGAKRTLFPSAAWPLTNGVNLILPGNVNYTCAAGDRLEVLAKSTTQFQVSVVKSDGSPSAGPAFLDAGTIVAAGTAVLAMGGNSVMRRIQSSGALTITVSGWPTAGTLGELLIEAVNFGLGTPVFPAGNWIKSDGSFAATPAAGGVTFQSAGTDFVLAWSRDGGTTIYYKASR